MYARFAERCPCAVTKGAVTSKRRNNPSNRRKIMTEKEQQAKGGVAEIGNPWDNNPIGTHSDTNTTSNLCCDRRYYFGHTHNKPHRYQPVPHPPNDSSTNYTCPREDYYTADGVISTSLIPNYIIIKATTNLTAVILEQRPISITPGSMEACEYGLTRGTSVVTRSEEVAAVAELLWTYWCVWVRRDFVFTFLIFSLRTHTACCKHRAFFILPHY